MVFILPLEELGLGKLCPCYLPKWSLFSTKETSEEESVLFANIFKISKNPNNLVTIKLLYLLLGEFFSYFFNHNNPQGFISDLSHCLLVPIFTVASESHAYLPFSKERKLQGCSVLIYVSLVCFHLTLGAVLMLLRGEDPNNPYCLMMFKYVFNKPLQLFCLNGLLCVGLLDISVFHHEGQRDTYMMGTCMLKEVLLHPHIWILSFKCHVREISANSCLLLRLCFQRQRLQCGSCFLRNCQYDLRTKSKKI